MEIPAAQCEVWQRNGAAAESVSVPTNLGTVALPYPLELTEEYTGEGE
jgi:hypothetical protein